jgi:hypothetical protein
MSKNLTPLYFGEHFEHCEGSLYDGDDFAVWLAENDGKVAKSERERIVWALESMCSYWKSLFEDSDGYESNVGSRYGGAVVALDDAIAVIKGENK